MIYPKIYTRGDSKSSHKFTDGKRLHFYEIRLVHRFCSELCWKRPGKVVIFLHLDEEEFDKCKLIIDVQLNQLLNE